MDMASYRRDLRLSSFMTAADYCENSDLLFVAPEMVGRKISLGRNITIKPVSKELVGQPINFSFYWHERYHRDSMCIWVRQKITEYAQGS